MTISLISLSTPILPKEKLYPTPSMQDGLAYEYEFDLRLTGCELIQTSGRLLRLPQVSWKRWESKLFLSRTIDSLSKQTAMATAQVLFQRYYYSKSFVKNNMEVLHAILSFSIWKCRVKDFWFSFAKHYAMGSIFLSSKIEESPRRLRDVMNVFHHIKQLRTGKVIKPMAIDQQYNETKNHIIKAERRILKELGFCVHVKHPHKVSICKLSLCSSHPICIWPETTDQTVSFIREFKSKYKIELFLRR